MEPLLNCCWLLLFVPALWIWRRQRFSIRKGHHGSLQCLVSLVCAVFLLFPVISASDDLHAMRSEMEEPGSGKRAFRQAQDQRASAQFHPAPLAATLAPAFVLSIPHQTLSRSAQQQVLVFASAALSALPSRAPPALVLFGL